jgi:hypothetical protein
MHPTLYRLAFLIARASVINASIPSRSGVERGPYNELTQTAPLPGNDQNWPPVQGLGSSSRRAQLGRGVAGPPQRAKAHQKAPSVSRGLPTACERLIRSAIPGVDRPQSLLLEQLVKKVGESQKFIPHPIKVRSRVLY